MADTKTWQMFIGGTWADSSTGETEPDINPATGESVATKIVLGDTGRQKLFDWRRTMSKASRSVTSLRSTVIFCGLYS